MMDGDGTQFNSTVTRNHTGVAIATFICPHGLRERHVIFTLDSQKLGRPARLYPNPTSNSEGFTLKSSSRILTASLGAWLALASSIDGRANMPDGTYRISVPAEVIIVDPSGRYYDTVGGISMNFTLTCDDAGKITGAGTASALESGVTINLDFSYNGSFSGSGRTTRLTLTMKGEMPGDRSHWNLPSSKVWAGGPSSRLEISSATTWQLPSFRPSYASPGTISSPKLVSAIPRPPCSSSSITWPFPSLEPPPWKPTSAIPV